MGEEHEDIEEAFRALKASIVAALEAALAGAPKGYTWPLAHPFFALRKTGGDQYSLVGMGGGHDRLSKKQAVALILMFMVTELINDG